MKVMKCLVVCLFCALLCGCGGQKNEGIPVVELGKAKGEIDLKLSDLLENIRLIPLETHPDVLLPGNFSAWVGEQYIVTFGEDAIHLFTVDGKYVRKLAQQGRGPNEYLYAMAYCVDKQEQYAYLAESTGCICVIDLEKGGIVRKISTGKNMPLRLLYSDKDNTLLYLPGMMKDAPDCAICRIALDGTLLHTVKSSSTSGTITYLKELNDTIRYKMLYCDTLFLLTDTVKMPYCRLVTESPYDVTTGYGRMIYVLFENRDRLVLGCEERRERRAGKAIYASVKPLEYYVLEKSDFSLRKVKGFYADIFDYTETNLFPRTDFFPLQVCGGRACQYVSVLRFKELLKDKLDNPLIPEYVKALYAQLDEEDNPVLLLGDIK